MHTFQIVYQQRDQFLRWVFSFSLPSLVLVCSKDGAWTRGNPPSFFFFNKFFYYIYIYVLILIIFFYKITFWFPLNNIIDSFKSNAILINFFTNCFDSKILLVHIWVHYSLYFFYLSVTIYHISNL